MTVPRVIEFDEYIAPDGEVYVFHKPNDRFLISFSGMGMPPLEYIVQPEVNGETPLDFRLTPRVIQYVHRRHGCNRQGYWNNRADILNLLRPNRQFVNTFNSGTLLKTLPDGSQRAIDVLIQQGPVFQARSTSNWDEGSFTESLRFIAHDPTFYDPTSQELSFELEALEHLIFNGIHDDPGAPDRIVFENIIIDPPSAGTGLIFGGTLIDEIQDVYYTGTWLSYPTITIDGPFGKLTLTNITTGDKIEILQTLPIGRTLTITLEPGNKTIVDDLGNNFVGSLSTDSDLITFSIVPYPQSGAGGLNQIRVQASDALPGATAIRFNYFTRYIGI